MNDFRRIEIKSNGDRVLVKRGNITNKLTRIQQTTHLIERGERIGYKRKP